MQHCSPPHFFRPLERDHRRPLRPVLSALRGDLPIPFPGHRRGGEGNSKLPLITISCRRACLFLFADCLFLLFRFFVSIAEVLPCDHRDFHPASKCAPSFGLKMCFCQFPLPPSLVFFQFRRLARFKPVSPPSPFLALLSDLGSLLFP